MDAQEWTREFEDIWGHPAEVARLDALHERLPFLSEQEKLEALQRAAQFEQPYTRLEAFKAVLRTMTRNQALPAAGIARETSDPALLAYTAHHVDEPAQSLLVEEAWALLRDLEDPYWQWEALSPLLPLLPEAFQGPAGRIIRGFSDSRLRTEGLVSIAEAVEGRDRMEALSEALAAARSIPQVDRRATALSLVAPHLPEPTRQEAVEEAVSTARKVPMDSPGRAESLIDVAELLPESDQESVYQDALDALRSMKGDRAAALLRLAPLFPRSYRSDLVEIAKDLDNRSERADVLLRLHEYADAPEPDVVDVSKAAEGVEQTSIEPEAEADEEPAQEQMTDSGASDVEDGPAGKGPEAPAAPDQDVAVTIQSDAPARFDELNRAPFANVLATTMQEVWEGRDTNDADALGAPGDAFIIHVHGPWGAGKSSVLNFLRERLTDGVVLPGEERPKDPWVVIWFNAWRHQRIDPPWMALIQSIYRQGRAQVTRGRRLKLFFRTLGWRLRTGAAPYILAGAVLLWLISLAAGLPDTPGEATDGVGAVNRFGLWLKGVAENSKGMLELLAILLAVWGLLLGGFRALMFGSADTASRFIELSHDPMQPIVKHFRNLVKAFGRPVAIFIDDLDRCDKAYVLEALRGLQTLFHEANVTYVIAADREWVRASYESAYSDFAGSVHGPGRPLGYLFLDKLFQVSVCIPRLSPAKQKEYLQSLVRDGGGRDEEALEKAEKAAEEAAERELGSQYEHAAMLRRIDREADLGRKRALQAAVARRLVSAKASRATEHVLQEFAPLLEANPRAMKRLVNAYGFNKAISLLADQDLDVGPLARWTIVEMRWPVLARRLEHAPELADSIGVTSAAVDSEGDLADLFQDSEVIEVIRGQTSGGAAPLDTASLREILGST